jgi:4-amino-4-deoxy-L-arabinose transferase-like glycosyltransferase
MKAKSYVLPLSCYIRHVLEQERKSLRRAGRRPFWRMLREYRKYFLLVTLAAFALRLLFYFRFPHVIGDSLIYGDIAQNWLNHGIFGLSHADGPQPTWIRLPGYPAFLAACFALFGREHYHAVLLVQIFFDLAGCFFIADLARRTVSERAGRFAFLLAALCPFTANYTVAPLAETLSIFFTAVALDCAVAAFMASEEGHSSWVAWAWCGAAVSSGIMLRPDGGILLVTIGLFLLWRLWRRPAERTRLFWAGALLLAISIAPLVPWTLRNWRVFHRFEPLAPRYANDPDEFVPSGYDKWVRTWIADFVSTDEIYWNIPGDAIDWHLLPSRAFDSAEQREKTEAIFRDYDKIGFVNPDLNARFGQVANERIQRHLLRYYVGLPMFRIADMWLRPRTEMLPLTSRWWEYRADPQDFMVAALWGMLNLLFVLAAVMGVVRGPRPRYLALMLLFVLLRSAFLGTLENPEPRYTLECYPVVLVLAGAWISGWEKKKSRSLAR